MREKEIEMGVSYKVESFVRALQDVGIVPEKLQLCKYLSTKKGRIEKDNIRQGGNEMRAG